jgi:hypothetical protein
LSRSNVVHDVRELRIAHGRGRFQSPSEILEIRPSSYRDGRRRASRMIAEPQVHDCCLLLDVVVRPRRPIRQRGVVGAAATHLSLMAPNIATCARARGAADTMNVIVRSAAISTAGNRLDNMMFHPNLVCSLKSIFHASNGLASSERRRLQAFTVSASHNGAVRANIRSCAA